MGLPRWGHEMEDNRNRHCQRCRGRGALYSGTFMKNSRKEWVPAIPLPYYLLKRFKCTCGAKFWTIDGYRGHYALKHILDPD